LRISTRRARKNMCCIRTPTPTGVLLCGAVCCSVLQCVAVCGSTHTCCVRNPAPPCRNSLGVAVCCIELQCAAVCQCIRNPTPSGRNSRERQLATKLNRKHYSSTQYHEYSPQTSAQHSLSLNVALALTNITTPLKHHTSTQTSESHSNVTTALKRRYRTHTSL